jgi:hypothetical protein
MTYYLFTLFLVDADLSLEARYRSFWKIERGNPDAGERASCGTLGLAATEKFRLGQYRSSVIVQLP